MATPGANVVPITVERWGILKSKQYLYWLVWPAIASLAACSGYQAVPSSNMSAAPVGVDPIARQRLAPLYYGCPVFAGNDYYSAPVIDAQVDPNSEAYIASVRKAGDTAPFSASTGVEKVNLANDNTPSRTVMQKSPYHHFSVSYPWAAGFYIEPRSDRHAMVVQTQTCDLYEAYGTSYRNGRLSAYSGAHWDLRKPFAPLTKGDPSAMASGLSLFAGMVRWEDYESGSISHALNWAATAHTVAEYDFVLPASDTDRLPFYGKSSYQLPYGARLRLKASFSTAGWGPQSQMVATAIKTYGIYLADTGPSSNALYFANAEDGSDPWNSSDLSHLSKIHIGDFEVLKLPRIEHVGPH
jgi:hypothetical protein